MEKSLKPPADPAEELNIYFPNTMKIYKNWLWFIIIVMWNVGIP